MQLCYTLYLCRHYAATPWVRGWWTWLSLCQLKRTNGTWHSKPSFHWSWTIQWQFVWDKVWFYDKCILSLSLQNMNKCNLKFVIIAYFSSCLVCLPWKRLQTRWVAHHLCIDYFLRVCKCSLYKFLWFLIYSQGKHCILDVSGVSFYFKQYAY